jgi:hypothetical protein
MANTFHNIIEQRDRIIKEAKQLGFVDLKIFHNPPDGNEPDLTLIVTRDPDNPKALNQYAGLLSAHLSNLLNCDVGVLVSTEIKELYRDTISKNTVSLNDTEGIKSLFKIDDLRKVEFPSPEQDSLPFQKRILKNLEQIKSRLATSVSISPPPAPVTASANFFDVQKKRKQPDNAEKSIAELSKKVRIKTDTTDPEQVVYTITVTVPRSCANQEHIMAVLNESWGKQTNSCVSTIPVEKK